ncbi:porin PorA family protein [Nocardia sp. NPDC051900]|uniref:porin PorA family protein n=1 Tax=Nocardia sp. NPDC051900 TaxID=3364326 RepID=UPI00378DF6C7
MKYLDDATSLDGLQLLHFRTQLHSAPLTGLVPMRGNVTLPARILENSSSEQVVKMHLFSSAIRDFWVEPATGSVVSAAERQLKYLATSPGGSPSLTVFEGTMRSDEQTVMKLIKKSHEARQEIALLRTDAPVIASIAAAVTLAFGAWRLPPIWQRGRTS